MKRILTRKQTMVLDLILTGKDNREIAEALSISVKGVKYHKTNIFKMYSVRNTRNLVKKYTTIKERKTG